jgi:molybdate transport system permease protein
MTSALTWLWETYAAEPVVFSLGLTARVCLYALLLQAVIGIGIAWYLSGRRPPFKGLVDNLVTFPLIFPPIATGYLLLMLFGRLSPVGSLLRGGLGIELVFSFPGIVLAAFIAGLPLVVKPVESAIRSLGLSLVEASYTLGRGTFSTFFRVVLPGLKKNILSALVLALGRSLGEVGITLMIGGNIIGKTNTLSLEVFNAVYDGDFRRATALCLLLLGFSLLLFKAVGKLENARVE